MRPSESVRSNILRYATSSLLLHVASALTAYLRPRFLSPEHFGIWSLLVVLRTYAGYAHLGSRTGLRYYLPRLATLTDDAEAERAERTTYVGSMAVTLVVAVGLVVVASTLRLVPEVELAVLVAAAVLVINCRYEHQVVVLKGLGRFRLLSRSDYVVALSTVVLTLLLTPALGLVGAMLGLFTGLAVTVLFISRRSESVRSYRFHLPTFLSLARAGLPVMGYDLLSLLLRTSDRLLVFAFLGTKAVGLYTIGSSLVALLARVPGASREVVESDMMAAGMDPQAQAFLDSYVTEPLRRTAVLMPVAIGTGWFLLSPLVEQLLPEYVQSVPPARIMLLCGYFLALTYPVRGAVIAYRLERPALQGLLAMNALQVLLAGGVGAMGGGLEMIATAILIAGVATFATLWRVLAAGVGGRELFVAALRVGGGMFVLMLTAIVAGSVASWQVSGVWLPACAGVVAFGAVYWAGARLALRGWARG